MCRILCKVIAGMEGPILLANGAIKEKFFRGQVNILFKVFAEVYAIMKKPGIGVFYPFTIKDDPLHPPVFFDGGSKIMLRQAITTIIAKY
jgi:hypothetical protein